jgi:hypothetical protein
MNKVKIGFNLLSVPEQIERARLIVGKMTGNPYFTTPNPALADVGKAADELEKAYNESRGHDKTKIAAMRMRRTELLSLIGQLAAYVQQVSAGDTEQILSSGFDVRNKNTPHSDTAGKTDNLQLKDGSTSGKATASWNAADNAVLYSLRYSLTGDFTDAQFAGITSKTHKEIGTFKPGTKVWVEVTALGRENPGPASEPVSIISR